MSEARAGACAGERNRRGDSGTASFGAADWLGLAASPVFAVMALVTVIQGSDPAAAFCSAAIGAMPLNGMALMYGLMSIVHLAPWLRLLRAGRL